MKFSTARELITPSIKVTMSGYAARSDEFSTIHDDLYVKCVYIENNSTNLFVIAFDLLHYKYSLNEEIFNYLLTTYKIKKENIIISYSHTHAGPKVASSTESDSPLYDFYVTRVKSCIDRTFLSIQKGSLSLGVTSGRWNVNRRRLTKDGYKIAPNYENITDDELSIFVIKDANSTIKAVLYNYSCHPVTLSGTLHLSSEFPGRVNQLVEAEFYGSNCLFLQGAAGNMRPKIAAYGEIFKPCTFDQVDEMAKNIKNKIINTISRNQLKLINPKFEGITFTIKPKIQPLDIEFFKNRVSTLPGYLKPTTQHLIDNFNSQNDYALIHSGIIKLSEDLYIVYMGGEICYEIKLIIKEVFKEKQIVFLGYHEALTYIPSDKIIKEGGYEGFDAPTYSGFRGPFKVGIDRTIRDAFTKRLF